ncbi:hypothetical protein V2J09_003154 [Rumex salicifolius]
MTQVTHLFRAVSKPIVDFSRYFQTLTPSFLPNAPHSLSPSSASYLRICNLLAMPREEMENGDAMEIDGVNPTKYVFNPNHLKVYYTKLFPYVDMFKWLSYANDGKHPACDSSYFGRREFSFTLENDIYFRYQSFTSASELENAIKEKCPYKIDIGPVYSVDPSRRHAYAQTGDNVFTPVERELIFDLDMTDYDDVRYCCSEGDVCLDCWPLMTIAIKVIDAALRDDFGFNHILWAYSGRRGVHCWVCDGRARRLTNEQRSAIADYFHVYKVSY